MTSGNMLPTIMIHSGKYFDFLRPEDSIYEITDIAHGLSNICRFGGHCNEFYSVAQHCVMASQFVKGSHCYDALMHDAAEAFIGDIPSPLKMLLPDYKKIEKKIEADIFKRFNVNFPLPPEVKHIDLVMLATERRDLTPPDNGDWGILEGITPLRQTIKPWSPKEAYEAFINRYNKLTGYIS